MIPPFEPSGYLPPGIHPATIEEVEERFGRESELRRVQMESLGWLLDLARKAGVRRIVLNGSFVTDVYEPNDVDCALLIEDDFPRDPLAVEEILEGLPFLDVELVNPDGWDELVGKLYATDRRGTPMGESRGDLMDLKNSKELEVTRDKIRSLEARYEEIRGKPANNPHVRELTLRSLKKLINQLKEEIVRYQIHHGVAAGPES
ncbi:MAG: hypothetical protein U0800_07400 [Isosphaeraceae bacterium]